MYHTLQQHLEELLLLYYEPKLVSKLMRNNSKREGVCVEWSIEGWRSEMEVGGVVRAGYSAALLRWVGLDEGDTKRLS